MIKVGDLSATTLYLFKDQTYRGRCIVALKEHKRELFELTPEEKNAWVDDVARTAQALTTLFAPGKINYAAYGDKVSHFHMHLVPKYETGPLWGSAFEMSPSEKKFLSEGEYQSTISKIRTFLAITAL